VAGPTSRASGQFNVRLPDELAGLDAIDEKRIILMVSVTIGHPLRKLIEAHLEYLDFPIPASDDVDCSVVFHESKIDRSPAHVKGKWTAGQPARGVVVT